MTAPPSTPLSRALAALDAGRMDEAARMAERAVELDRASVEAWRILALAQEALGDVPQALAAYETALGLAPSDADLMNGLARLALEMDLPSTALGLAQHALVARPGDAEAARLVASAFAREGRFAEAVQHLTGHLSRFPEQPIVWNVLGAIASDAGEVDTAELALAEAIRLDPGLAAAQFNRANLWMNCGQIERALAALEAIPETGLSPRERATLRFTRACARLRLGDLDQGWREYQARNDASLSGAAHFDLPGRRWSPGHPLKGLDLLIVGEQGLGDEVMFGGMIPDLISGADRPASLSLAVEPRLVSLFQRSFPDVVVGAHATIETAGRRVRRLPTPTNLTGFGSWAPMGDLLPVLRPDAAAFPDRRGYLKADPHGVAQWREWLSQKPRGLKFGLLWKSGLMTGARRLAFAGFETWAPVLTTPGATFVNLQYGDTDEEIAFAQSRLGIKILTPPGLDLKQDLEGVAALSCALDLVIGVSNASFNLAAACGVEAWLVSAADAWTLLGTDAYPWYPQVRLFASRRPGDWEEVMEGVAQALKVMTAD